MVSPRGGDLGDVPGLHLLAEGRVGNVEPALAVGDQGHHEPVDRQQGDQDPPEARPAGQARHAPPSLGRLLLRARRALDPPARSALLGARRGRGGTAALGGTGRVGHRRRLLRCGRRLGVGGRVRCADGRLLLVLIPLEHRLRLHHRGHARRRGRPRPCSSARTPSVERPVRRIESTSMRMTWPSWEISSSSWPSRTGRAVISSPLRSVTLMRADALGGPALARVVRHRGALAVAVAGHDQQVLVVAGHAERQDPVALVAGSSRAPRGCRGPSGAPCPRGSARPGRGPTPPAGPRRRR